MPGLGKFRRLSPSRDFRHRRAGRHAKLVLTSFFILCLIFFYTNSIHRKGEILSRKQQSTEPTTLTNPHLETIRDDIKLKERAAPTPTPVPAAKIKDEDFEVALRRLEDMLPGEMETRWMLNKIQGTGAEKLREIGLRAREYKKFFQAWENLHLVEDGPDATFLQYDMVQHIRRYFSAHSDDMPSTAVDRTIHTYEKFRAFMTKFGQLMAAWTGPYFADHMALHLSFKHGGRGVVVTAGNSQVPHLKTLIHSLRDVGCNLPIEVMYLDDSDMDVDLQAELDALDGVLVREIAPMVDDQGWKLAGWALKPFAILFSSFREAIFIDADSLFFQNPETLFEDEDYQMTGALFFKDRTLWPEWKRDWLKDLLPRPISAKVLASRYWRGESGHQQESGVVVIDKWRHFVAMLMVCRMNGPERNGNKEQGTVGVYDMVYGDKETFWLGWELVGDTDYAFHRGGVAVMGNAESSPAKEEIKFPEKKNEDDVESEINMQELKRAVEASAEEKEKEETEQKETKSAAKDGMTAPMVYTICAPQLLHLAKDGRPLWFNGGLLDNKFAEKKDRILGNFSEYVAEPAVVTPATWQLLGGNKACLTGEIGVKYVLTASEKSKVDMMIGHAKKYY
ncbi:hypothetical protein NLG97_g3382 [Lecanicillium saksenae]|uniref:Uncharacterized protein n=1 Tax=Lecanicillium saksenae TaxID=468837 RepID=A0ACC1R1L6_9HYPO|nr:hypothetical protein NLG97_g3382 [Lecanicillium saksenae]